jgi:hypothetical protein
MTNHDDALELAGRPVEPTRLPLVQDAVMDDKMPAVDVDLEAVA